MRVSALDRGNGSDVIRLYGLSFGIGVLGYGDLLVIRSPGRAYALGLNERIVSVTGLVIFLGAFVYPPVFMGVSLPDRSELGLFEPIPRDLSRLKLFQG